MVSIGWVADGEAAIPSVVEVLPRPDGGASGSRIVLVPVGARDRRAVLAARYAALIPAAERRAVHVAVDPRVGEELYLEWIYDPPAALPLDIVPDIGGIACSVVSMVNECRETGASDVVVLLGQLTMRRAATTAAARLDRNRDQRGGAGASRHHRHPAGGRSPRDRRPSLRTC